MINCDLFGFCYYMSFKKEGTEFPRPFVMKNMSRVGLCCRHPLDSGFYFIYIASLFYGQLTLGRLLFSIMFFIGVTIGNHFEEKEIYKVAAKSYSEFSKVIPNRLIPDFAVFLKSEA